MARQQVFVMLMACLLVTLLLLSTGVYCDVQNDASSAGGDSNEQQQQQQQLQQQNQQEQEQQQRLPAPSPTAADWTDVPDLKIPAVAMSLRLTKRAPNGFIGMRGKKEMERDSPNVWLWSSGPMPLPVDNTGTTLQTASAMRYKKSPSAFYGVRGKKYGAASELNRFNHMLHQLEQERLREQLLQDFLDRVAGATATENEINTDKRAPIGFTGVRGKRPNNDINNSLDELNTIGDRDRDRDIVDDVDVDDDDDDDAMDNDNDDVGEILLNKRGPSNAFLGVRGKKSVDHQHFKRSPTERSLFRWRQTYGGGNGIRSGGKQQRFVDFGNKFVAVRGKKDSTMLSANYGVGAGIGGLGGINGLSSPHGLQALWRGAGAFEERPWYGLLPAAASSAEFFYDKRAPSGFMGMRGKRAASDAYVAVMANTITTETTPTKQTPLKQIDMNQNNN